jgi:hypothetical protein
MGPFGGVEAMELNLEEIELFLDADGTPLDFARGPGAMVVPGQLSDSFASAERQRGFGQDKAIEKLVTKPPFLDRRPLVIADDSTMSARLGGLGR